MGRAGDGARRRLRRADPGPLLPRHRAHLDRRRLKVRLAICAAAAALVALISHRATPEGHDFIALYAAARLVATGRGALVTDASALLAVEHETLPARTVLLNDPNPPALALLMAPFGALPYDAAFALWLALSTVALALAIALIGRGAAPDQRARLLPFALLAPTSLVALSQGQTTPLLLLAVVAGAPALLVLRPQLLPLYALASSRRHLALAVAAVAALSLLAAGWDGLARWPERLAYAAGEISPNEVSLPGLARRLGLPAEAALVLAVVVFAAGAALVRRAPLAIGPLALLAAPHSLLHDVVFAYPAVAALARTRRSVWLWSGTGVAASLLQLVGIPAVQLWLVALATRSAVEGARPGS